MRQQRWIHEDELARWFQFHPPATDRVRALHEQVRTECHELAHWINENVPESPEKTDALRQVQKAMWAANAAVAIHQPRPVAPPDPFELAASAEESRDREAADQAAQHRAAVVADQAAQLGTARHQRAVQAEAAEQFEPK